MAFEGIKNFFSNSFETSDNLDKEYATHYYRNDYSTIKDAIKSVAHKMGYDVTNVDDQYKELLLASRTKGEMIITITSLSYYENAIDIKATTHYVIACGRAKKRVKEFYETINKTLNLKRIGGGINEY